MSRFQWNPLLSKEYRGRRLLSAGCTHPGTPWAARGEARAHQGSSVPSPLTQGSSVPQTPSPLLREGSVSSAHHKVFAA